MPGTAKTKPTKPPVAPTEEDPRFQQLLDALSSVPAYKAIINAYLAGRNDSSPRKFGSNGLKVNGKIFAMVTRGRLVVKLPKGRVDDLVASGTAENFDPGHGRLMKEWASIVSDKLSWLELVREAHDFVKGAK